MDIVPPETGDIKKDQDYECKRTGRHFNLLGRGQNSARRICVRIPLWRLWRDRPEHTWWRRFD